jgi:hypothetical protein
MSSYVTEQMRKSLENHVLELIQYGAVTAYYLKDPAHGRMMSTLVTFSPEGITISGDLTPNRSGLVSAYGYGIGWFGSDKSEGYLCEKFLDKQYVHEAAQDELRDADSHWRQIDGALPTAEEKEQLERLDEIIEALDEHDAEWLISELEDAGYVVDDGPPGYTYEPHEAGWLCAIQQRFAELYQAEIAVPKFLLCNRSAGYLGNSPVFWAEGGGYSQWIDQAKRFTAAEAEGIIRSTKSSHYFEAIPLETLQRIAKRTVDMQDLRKESSDEKTSV